VQHNLSEYQTVLDQINGYREQFAQLDDQQILEGSRKLRRAAVNAEAVDEYLPAAFVLVCVTIQRHLDLTPHDSQIIGAIALHRGKLAEMQTGEGKTLMAVLPAYLNALTGKGVHVFTFNDYLAQRDAEWMGPIYKALGISVGVVQAGMDIESRQQAYAADVTYLTAKEAGFDYLRDGLTYSSSGQVHRPFHYVIIDEVDSILIDEARIPLVIAGPKQPDDSGLLYGDITTQLVTIARQLNVALDVGFDRYARTVFLTTRGIQRAEQLLKIDDLYAEDQLGVLTRLHCALIAEHLLRRDVDYIVKEGTVQLVDELTGRVADGRRWPDGIQEALEAKEGLLAQEQGQIFNSIALQYLLLMYPKISGMTATAQSAEEEFKAFYGLDIVVLPPHQPPIRHDYADRVFKTKWAKENAIVEEIRQVHKMGRPILVGTASVAESAHLAARLQKIGINCQVLNAKHDAYEAQIIAQAGQLGGVTISTNMAGRGTDIRLGGLDEQNKDEVIALGGLYVIGTNKHESPRLDQQLRGRAGRQGEPGSSRFFISLADDLFVTYRLNELLKDISLENGSNELDNAQLNKKIDRLQRIVVGQNLEIKKTLVKYTYLIEQQRKIVFQKRTEILNQSAGLAHFETHCAEQFTRMLNADGCINELCKILSLAHLDQAWSDYLEDVSTIQEGSHLARIGKLDPVLEFHKAVIARFNFMWQAFEMESARAFNELDPENPDIQSVRALRTGNTWTYLVNDEPFERKPLNWFI